MSDPARKTNDPDAIKANTARNFITQRGFEMIKAMIMVGEILSTKKARLRHGSWMSWVITNLDFSYKTATNYIRLYENRDEVLAQEPGTLQDAIAIIGAKGKRRI